MSSFFVELWEGIFTPGPTPTLLKAANGSFAALQLVLLLMFAATYNVHCLVLSILCAGLWWSINWFAAELAIAQREQREKEEREKREAARDDDTTDGDEDETETEVETASASASASAPAVAAVPSKAPPAKDPTTLDAAVAAGLEPVEPKGEVTQRVAAAGTQSSVSTEDEWEKVSEAENEKDK
ncbi:SMK killer toxin resistance protein [Fusarium piperis]|uniref:SMK killer toxin resistance protein n=1 Tax=Fusarium piperis TaxID=1435070 RepID=A0A9W9BSU9_9HYPO|nr:SMK killer toxin resistance protein [Fusarium piperis]